MSRYGLRIRLKREKRATAECRCPYCILYGGQETVRMPADRKQSARPAAYFPEACDAPYRT